MMRHSACISRLFLSRKRQLLKPRSDEPPPSDGSMKNGVCWPSLSKAVWTRPRNDSTHASRRIGRCCDGFVVDHAESRTGCRCRVVVNGGAEEAAAAGVPGDVRESKPERALRVQVGDFCAQAGKRLRRVHGFH